MSSMVQVVRRDRRLEHDRRMSGNEGRGCTRSLTSTIRLRARALSATPIARQTSTAGARPSASARPTTRAISPTSSTFRPITSTSPSGKLRAIRRTACFSRPLSSALSTTALCTALSALRSDGRFPGYPRFCGGLSQTMLRAERGPDPASDAHWSRPASARAVIPQRGQFARRSPGRIASSSHPSFSSRQIRATQR
jgi:hypothetical protein